MDMMRVSKDFDWSLSDDISLECRLAEIGSKETEIAAASAQRLLVPGFQEPSSSRGAGVAQGLFFKSAAARAQRNQSAQGQSAAAHEGRGQTFGHCFDQAVSGGEKNVEMFEMGRPVSSSDNILSSGFVFPCTATHDSIKGHLWQVRVIVETFLRSPE